MTTPPRPPNILLITSDQHHHTCLGSVNPKIKTPALDRLANEGTRFDRAYTPNPVCTPTRASIITGLYPSVHGAWTIGVKLPEDVPTVGTALSHNGYRTSLVGKAHFQPMRSTPESPSIETPEVMRDLDFWRAFKGPWYGFDNVEITRGHADEASVGAHYAIWMEEHGLSNWRDYFRPHPPPGDGTRPRARHGAWDIPERFHYNNWIAERSVAQIDQAQQAGQPFFLWASFHDPHPPYLVPEPWASMYHFEDMEPGRLIPGEHDQNPPHFRLTQEDRPDYKPWQETEWGNHGFRSHRHEYEAMQRDMAIYYGMVSFMDQAIGRMLAHLDQLGLAENTLVVFSTDHGHFLGQHGLNAKGAFLYEDAIRIPFLVRWPDRVPAGRVSSELQSTVDLTPTFLTAAGLPVPGLIQGYDQTPAWCAPDHALPLVAPVAQGVHRAPRDHVVVENRHQPTAVHQRTYVDARYKITVYRSHPEGSADPDIGELFDLEDDPGEAHNLWNDPSASDLKTRLLLNAVRYEIAREPTRMPRVSGA